MTKATKTETNKGTEYTIILPDGNKATRTTKKEYTHVLLIRWADGHYSVAMWSGSMAGAQREFRTRNGKGGYADATLTVEELDF